MNIEGTQRQSTSGGTRWQDWGNLIVGVWLFMSPWIMHVTSITDVARNSWVIGAIVIAASLWALWMPTSAVPQSINTLAGLWLLISPWIFIAYGFAHGLSFNGWVSGMVVLVLSIWAAAWPERGGSHPTGTAMQS